MKKSFPLINRLAIVAAMLTLFLVPAATRAQSITRLSQTAKRVNENEKAISALKRLQDQVIVYRSFGEFEENGRLARVPLQTFEMELRDVTLELQPIISEMPPSKLRNEIVNALASYRDGLFWWQKIDQPHVVHVSALRYDEQNRTPSDLAFLSNVPYTVAINWRQAQAYLIEAERLLAK